MVDSLLWRIDCSIYYSIIVGDIEVVHYWYGHYCWHCNTFIIQYSHSCQYDCVIVWFIITLLWPTFNVLLLLLDIVIRYSSYYLYCYLIGYFVVIVLPTLIVVLLFTIGCRLRLLLYDGWMDCYWNLLLTIGYLPLLLFMVIATIVIVVIVLYIVVCCSVIALLLYCYWNSYFRYWWLQLDHLLW